MSRVSHVMKVGSLVLMGCLLATLLLEGFLRLYNPFEARVKGDRIVLPANKQYKIRNTRFPGLDSTLVHTKNSLGFRGPELPARKDNLLKIITVGGSTTECFYSSDGKTWTDLLADQLQRDFGDVWLNNAGLDGHSTVGHIIMMEDYVVRLKPQMVIFLVGGNDVMHPDTHEYDMARIRQGINWDSFSGFIRSVAAYSEAVSLGLNIYRYFAARKMGMPHETLNLKGMEQMVIPESTQVRILRMHQESFVPGYVRRLQRLIALSKENNIDPVFVTQPTLFGDVIDEIDSVDLGSVRVIDWWGDMNGHLKWRLLQLYNESLKQVGLREGVFVIDLASEMPKSSKYYYDFWHYTNEGNKRVADIIYAHLFPHLNRHYVGYAIR